MSTPLLIPSIAKEHFDSSSTVMLTLRENLIMRKMTFEERTTRTRTVIKIKAGFITKTNVDKT